MYLLRLDDASEHWNRENWIRMHDLCQKHNIKPIMSIIPHNENVQLLRFPNDSAYQNTISEWISNDGWTPALHGYNHVYIKNDGGVNPVNSCSEFAGVELDTQKEKIRDGINILAEMSIFPKIFVAPAHTFDKNTLIALEEVSNIRIISDTIAMDIYFISPFYFIPQQSGNARKLRLPLVTLCYHPNNMNNYTFKELEAFMKEFQMEFTSFDRIEFMERPLNMGDKFLRWLYFQKRKLKYKVK